MSNRDPLLAALNVIIRCLDDDNGVREDTFDNYMRSFVEEFFGIDSLAVLDNAVDLAEGRYYIPEAEDGGEPPDKIFGDIVLAADTSRRLLDSSFLPIDTSDRIRVPDGGFPDWAWAPVHPQLVDSVLASAKQAAALQRMYGGRSPQLSRQQAQSVVFRQTYGTRVEVSTMDVQKLIREMLESQGCTILEASGIWYVTTPEGKVWDMTPAMECAGTPQNSGPEVLPPR